MIKSITIVLLFTMGLASYQLPILWTAYKTVHADFARAHCINKGTSCNGSCSMKRAYVRTNSERARTIPTGIVSEVKDLSPFLLQKHEHVLPSLPSSTARNSTLETRPVSRHIPPPFTPPRG